MVWFQCEDCGEDLKKPKLPNHFRNCSASKLSCIDCGQVFGQHDVQGHTQCITEAEKYGPKGQGKASNGVNSKPKNESKPKPEVDINVGLSERPPWFCSLCNTMATSKQALLIHADGKKHRAKARGFHAAKQQPNGPVEANGSNENNAKNEVLENKNVDGENNALASDKKRKLEASENHISADLGNGEVIQMKVTKTEVKKSLKKVKYSATGEEAKLDSAVDEESGKKKIHWKKLITSALKSSPDGVMKFKKLRKFVVKSLRESGYTEDKTQLSEILEQKINSSSRFVVDEKYVRLATKSS